MNEIKIVTQLDRGLAYAEACFETFCVVDGEVFEQAEHMQRLQRGLHAYGLECSENDLKDWFNQAIIAATQQAENMLVRLTVSGGEAAWGLLPNDEAKLYVQVQMLPHIKHKALHLASVYWPYPLREKTAKYTADYAESLRAIQQWGLDNPMQALICSLDNHVLSTLTANIALYRDGQWWTPKGLGILSGVVRQFFIRYGILHETICPEKWLDDCEAIVCLNSGQLVQSVASVNQRDLDINHTAISELLTVLHGVSGTSFLDINHA